MDKSFKHKTPVQIRFKDMDSMGHVNNANYFAYVELARLRYFIEVAGPESDWGTQNGLILARTEIDFRMPMFFGDNVTVYTRCSRIGNKSFDLKWLIVRTNTQPAVNAEEIVAEGLSVLACYDYRRKVSIPVSAERKMQIEQFEGTKFS